MPSNFSPINPLAIKDLTVEETATVSKLENVTKKDDSGDIQTLKISGKAEPNSIVIAYIYSDPLIITTSTDSDGNWQYTLEDPLEPGKHEVYAIVNRGDGTYKRSNPMSFLISTAGASAVNPNGLSLNLGETPTVTPIQSINGLIGYIVGSVIALIAVFTGLYLIIRSRRKRAIQAAAINSETYPQVTPSALNTTNGVSDNIEEKSASTTIEKPVEPYPAESQQSMPTEQDDSINNNSVEQKE